jgi:3-oxoacyl-[acyl-carrier-protein] synthase III
MFPKSYIKAISYHLPELILTNEELRSSFPEWNIDELCQYTGVSERHIAASNETPSDLAVLAAEKLFAEEGVDKNEIDFILFCTQSNDYITPTTACVIQERLKVPKTAGAIDFNQGCSGFVYGLALADGLIKSGTASNVLLLTAETISRYINLKDKSSRFLFGDAGAACLVSNKPNDNSLEIGDFVLGSDGRGSEKIIIKYGAARNALADAAPEEFADEYGNIRSAKNFYMNGNAVFLFSLETVPKMITGLLAKKGYTVDDIDLFVFHQANKIILETLRKKLRIPSEKFILDIEKYGNTVSSSIPIAIFNAFKSGRIKKGNKIILAAFGVGYSWASVNVEC